MPSADQRISSWAQCWERNVNIIEWKTWCCWGKSILRRGVNQAGGTDAPLPGPLQRDAIFYPWIPLRHIEQLRLHPTFGIRSAMVSLDYVVINFIFAVMRTRGPSNSQGGCTRHKLNQQTETGCNRLLEAYLSRSAFWIHQVCNLGVAGFSLLKKENF